MLIARIIAALEPWYDWGVIEIENLNARTEDELVSSQVRFFDLQWFGLHLSIQYGRAPRRSRAEVCNGI
ncbi:hypothetical protein [Sphingomonas sanxanigenens]|uniref:Uncharacterized protein n=1 Tax=Sphingomonas sanxanigenens DSM 19645 = NX02 TaxID=1123269 RepID=W0ADA6_9SPHN|nr:hypothetical protein [Sphingomonas sanxanigenens]AHE55889.1 hypothetical protein NX02_21265 [Sphingomonas sanxanigenens DSM 19645 = NX02]